MLNIFILISFVYFTEAMSDQAPCIDWFLTNDDFQVCPNLTVADTNVSVLTLDNGESGLLTKSFRDKYFDLDSTLPYDEIVWDYVCYNDLVYCPECISANYSNTSDPLTINCTANDCTCYNFTQKVRYEASVGQAFNGFNKTEVAFLDLDSGPYIPYSGNPTPFGNNLLNINFKKRVVTVFVSFEQPFVTVTPSVPTTLFIWVSILSNNQMVTCNSTCTFKVNEAWLITQEDLWVTVYDGDVEIYEKSFKTDPISFCPIPNNPFSSVWAQSWSCMGATGRFLFVASILGAVVIIITLIIGMYKVSVCLYGQYQNKIYITMNDNTQAQPLEYSGGEEIQDLDTLRTKVFGRKPNNGLFMAVICCLICCASANACTNAVLSQSTVSSCTMVASTMTCAFKLNFEISLDGVGSASCLDVYDQTGKNQVFSLKLNYKQALYQIPLKKLYYTSDWRPMETSRHLCAGSIVARDLRKFCDEWNNLTTTCAHDFSSKDFGDLTCPLIPVGQPITTTCFDRVNCLPGTYICALASNKGCGVLDFDDSFVYGKFGYLPVGHVYKVLAPEASYLLPTVEVQVTAQNQNTTSEYMFTESVINVGDVIIRIVGSLDGPMNIFNNNKIILGMNTSEDSVAYYGAACEQNIPCAGGVGDIQSSSPTALFALTTTLDQFKYPIGAVTAIVKDSAMDFKFPPRGLVANIPILTQLPAVINGQIWTISDETLYINAVNTGPLLVKVESSTDLTFTQVIDTICPDYKVIGETNAYVGCSQCVQGLVIPLDIKSTCNAGLVNFKLTCSEGSATLITKNCMVKTTDYTECEIRVLPSTETLTCLLTIFNGNNEEEYEFTALTPELSTITNDTEIPVVDVDKDSDRPTIPTSSSMNGFLDWFNSLDGWKAGVKWTIVAVILTVLSIIVVVILVQMIKLIRSIE